MPDNTHLSTTAVCISSATQRRTLHTLDARRCYSVATTAHCSCYGSLLEGRQRLSASCTLLRRLLAPAPRQGGDPTRGTGRRCGPMVQTKGTHFASASLYNGSANPCSKPGATYTCGDSSMCGLSDCVTARDGRKCDNSLPSPKRVLYRRRRQCTCCSQLHKGATPPPSATTLRRQSPTVSGARRSSTLHW
jgi:hypothetical protein